VQVVFLGEDDGADMGLELYYGFLYPAGRINAKLFLFKALEGRGRNGGAALISCVVEECLVWTNYRRMFMILSGKRLGFFQQLGQKRVLPKRNVSEP
jgi:hypothetical protein